MANLEDLVNINLGDALLGRNRSKRFWTYEIRFETIKKLTELLGNRSEYISSQDLNTLESALNEFVKRSSRKSSHLHKSLSNPERAGLKTQFDDLTSYLRNYITEQKTYLGALEKPQKNLLAKQVKADVVAESHDSIERDVYRAEHPTFEALKQKAVVNAYPVKSTFNRFVNYGRRVKETVRKEKDRIGKGIREGLESIKEGLEDVSYYVPKPVTTGLGVLAAIVIGSTIKTYIPPIVREAEASPAPVVREQYKLLNQIPINFQSKYSQSQYPNIIPQVFGIQEKKSEQTIKMPTIEEKVRDEISCLSGIKRHDFPYFGSKGGKSGRVFYANKAGEIEATTEISPFAYCRIENILDSREYPFTAIVKGNAVKLFQGSEENKRKSLIVTRIDNEPIGITYRGNGRVKVAKKGGEHEIISLPEIPSILRCSS